MEGAGGSGVDARVRARRGRGGVEWAQEAVVGGWGRESSGLKRQCLEGAGGGRVDSRGSAWRVRAGVEWTQESVLGGCGRESSGLRRVRL